MRKLNKAADKKGSSEFGTRNAEWNAKLFGCTLIIAFVIPLIKCTIILFTNIYLEWLDIVGIAFFIVSLLFLARLNKKNKWNNISSFIRPLTLCFYISLPIIEFQTRDNQYNTFTEMYYSPSFRLLVCGIAIAISEIITQKTSEELSDKQNNVISFFELNTYSQSLTNYIRLCFPPKKWNKDAERITESMIQYVLTVKNPQSKEAFLKACLEMSEDLSGYSLRYRSYACNPVCKNLQSIPEEKLHSIFQEIHSILRERKENYESF